MAVAAGQPMSAMRGHGLGDPGRPAQAGRAGPAVQPIVAVAHQAGVVVLTTANSGSPSAKPSARRSCSISSGRPVRNLQPGLTSHCAA